MKHLIIPVFLLIWFTGCNNSEPKPKPKRKCNLIIYNMGAYGAITSEVQCDSFQMHDLKHAVIFVDGTKMEVSASSFIQPYAR